MRSCKHSEKECTSCFKERIRSISPAASATPSRRNHRTRPKGVEPKNSWEQAKAVDDRGMPYLNKDGGPIHVKTLAETRRDYRRHQTPSVNTQT